VVVVSGLWTEPLDNTPSEPIYQYPVRASHHVER